MLRADVFEAMTAAGGACRWTSAKTESLRSMRSGTASMTKSMPESAVPRLPNIEIRPRAAARSSAASLPSSTAFAPIVSNAALARSSASGDTSNNRVSNPPTAAAQAIPSAARGERPASHRDPTNPRTHLC